MKDKKLHCLNEVDNDSSLTPLSLHQLDTNFIEYKTDVAGRQVKLYNPSTKKVETLTGDGSEGAQYGIGKTCGFVQVHGICSVSDTLFTTDAAAGKIKVMTGLCGTKDFLEHLGILYDTFGITCKASTSQPITHFKHETFHAP